MLGDPFAPRLAPGRPRRSIIASGLHRRRGALRTACRQCKRSRRRSAERRACAVTCVFAIQRAATDRPYIHAEQESHLAAAVRIQCLELGSGATGIRTPDLLHAIRTQPIADRSHMRPDQPLHSPHMARRSPPSPVAYSPLAPRPRDLELLVAEVNDLLLGHPRAASWSVNEVHASRHRAARHDPLHRLAGDLGYEIVVAVVMQKRDKLPFSDSGDQQVGKPDCPDPSRAPQHGLHVQRAMPVLITGRQPLVAFLPISSDLVKLSARASRPAKLELDHTAGRYQPGLDQRTQHCRYRGPVQPGQRAGISQMAGYRRHAPRITSSSAKSGSPRETSRCRSRRRAASAVTCRSAALTVSFFVSVFSTFCAAASCSSSTSISVLAIMAPLPADQYIYMDYCRIYACGVTPTDARSSAIR